jgi:hypothetical protein
MSNRTDAFQFIRAKLQARLSLQQRTALRRLLAEPLGFLSRRNLRRLAQIYGSDKWSDHWYCQHYERHFAPFRTRKITVLEIGIGGYKDPAAGGRSLRMWRRYFPRARIYGIDIHDKRPHNERRIHTFQGDQSDERFLQQVIANTGRPNIIIDDGSHMNHHVLKSFQTLFPLLADDGIYVVEDTQTSYWPDFGGSSTELNSPAKTSMGMLKALTDGLNYADFLAPKRAPSYFDKHLVSIHFYHNIVFLCKGQNDEGPSSYCSQAPDAAEKTQEAQLAEA